MELLKPSPPPQPAGNDFTQLLSPAANGAGFDGEARTVVSPLPEIAEDGGDRVIIAVGKSMEKTVRLLQWTFQRFGNQEIGLFHVHQPSSTIPTLLGNLPANKASEEVVTAHRKEERNKTRKLLFNYLNICWRAKVKASIIAIEADQVQKGIVDLVNIYGIRKLVMGAVPDNCMKVKKVSSKADYAAKNAPRFCEIWFVNKGKHIWTREASEVPSIQPSFLSPKEIAHTQRLRSGSPHNHMSEPIFSPDECLWSSSSTTGRLSAGDSNWVQTEASTIEVAFSTIKSCSVERFSLLYSHSSLSSTSTSLASGYASSTDRLVTSESDLKVEEESLYGQFTETMREAEASKNEAFAELLKRKKLEQEALEVINKVKALNAAHAREVKFREEVENKLRTTRQEQEKIFEKKEEITRELQKTMRNVALLDIRDRESTRRREEAAGELRLIQESLVTLQHERQKIRRQKKETVHRLKRWRNRRQVGAPNCDGFIRLVNNSPEFTEFSLSDLRTATCNFSESFKIGQGGYGCVYKGEMSDQSVAIKKLHPHNMQGRTEFQQEVLVLSKLRHPNLVTLIGACLEAWTLVYEYLPNGSLRDHLFQKSNTPPLTWKTRTRIAAKISSALLFLHSSKPEKIIHGDLKPENILLDSDFNCKIGDFGICRLVPEETLRCPSFRQSTEPKGAFQYTDPELQRTGDLTSKSDIFSFGIIILQLLTGRPPVGLASEVRRALLCEKLASVLDMSAGEWPMSVARRLVELGLQFCELNSRDRPELTPTMVRELELLHVGEERPVPSFFLCPILQEIMFDPQVAADGFTYEGEALRGWLENGRETSPMTNLELTHLHLTPNHALREAIQDWLCQY